jgi:hypothetical protein
MPHRYDRFLTLIQLTQTHTWSGLWLGSHLDSCAIEATRPLAQTDICGIVTSPWTCHQFGNFGSRSGYRVIGIHWLTPSKGSRRRPEGGVNESLIIHSQEPSLRPTFKTLNKTPEIEWWKTLTNNIEIILTMLWSKRKKNGIKRTLD